MGIEEAAAEPQYNFITQFLSEPDEDSISESLFFNPSLSPYQDMDISCSYIQNHEICTLTDQTKFSILSLNIQSLPAKYDSLCSFINELSSSNHNPDIICLQEVWNVQDANMFN